MNSPSRTLTIQNVLAAQNALREKGLTPELLQLFALLDLDTATQELILQDLLALDPNQIGDFSENLLNSLKDPVFAAALGDSSQALKQGVVRGETTAVIPTPALLPGMLGFAALLLRSKSKRIKNRLMGTRIES